MDFTSLMNYLSGNTAAQSGTAANAATTPGTSSGNFFDKSDGFGLNANTLNFGLSGINSLGNLYNAFQANKLAKSQFDFTKNITNTNLANSIKSYNTSLSDRANSRGVVEGQTPDQVNSYISSNSL